MRRVVLPSVASVLVLVLASCGGEDTPVTPPTPKPAPVPPPALVGTGGAAAAQLTHGAALYEKYCLLCHGEGALGYRADFAPSLVSETFLATASDSFLATGISDGRPPSAMGAYGASRGGPLSATDVTALIAWLRSLRPEVKRLELPSAPARGDAARGKPLYATHCQSCHGDQGTRISAVQLANPVLLESATDEFLRYAIEHGRPGTLMLPWKDKLGAQAIDDIITYLRTWAPPMSSPLDPHAGHAHAATKPDPHAGHAHGAAPDPHAGHDHGQPAGTPALPPLTAARIVINPKGKAPVFTAREDRFVPSAQVADALRTKKKMIIVDARTPADFERGRIPGSILVPYYARERLDALANDGTWVLAYCACPHQASGEIVDELRKRGFKNTAIIDEGINFWQKQGYPMATGPAK